MGVKYILQYKSIDDVAWQCNIETPSYSDAPKAVRGVSEQAALIAYDPENADDPFNTFFKSTLTLNFYQEGQIDIDELQHAGDKDFTAKVFRNGHLYWAGYLQPENIEFDLESAPFAFQLTFICGLAMLDDIPYTHKDLPGLTGDFNRCPMNYIRQILFSTDNLGLLLPVRWTNQLQCAAFTDDIFTGSVRWSPFNEGFYSYQQGLTGTAPGPLKSCGYILRGMLKAMQCRIYQANGKWIIRRVNDVISGTVNYKEIAGDLSVMTVISGTQNLNQRIGRTGYRFVNENAKVTTKQGIKSFKSTYNANIRSNILPNGGFDKLNSALTIDSFVYGGILLYWGSYSTLSVTAQPSLDGQGGSAARLVSTSSTGGPDEYYTMISPGGVLGKNGLPIDALTLVKIINFGFMFSPGTDFAPVDGDGLIIWTSNPLEFKMILNQGSTQYFLNEFGYWTTVDGWVPIVVEGLKLGEIAQINFDKFQGIKIPAPPTEPAAGDICDLQIIFKVKPNQTYTLDNVSVTIDNGNDVYEVFNDGSKCTSSDSDQLDISSSFNGYMLSNFMSAFYNSDVESQFNDGLFGGTLTRINAHAVMRFRYKNSQIIDTDIYTAFGNWTFDEVYSIDSLLSKKYLPLKAEYNTEKGIVTKLSVIEARNDNITLRDSFYNSNDNINSN